MKSYSSTDIIKIMEKEGWIKDSQRGSHLHLIHPTKPGKVTVPHPRKDLKPKTVTSILKQAGLL